jgi:hypothetical protein
MSNTREQPARRGRLLAVTGLVAAAVLLAACEAEGFGTAEATSLATLPAGSASATDAAPTMEPGTRPTLPAGFPVPAGAVAQDPLNDDPAVVVRWTLATVGSGAYDYYLEALPAAGYPIVGRYPADVAALLRFEVAPGMIWQLLVEHVGGGTRVTVQLDRP